MTVKPFKLDRSQLLQNNRTILGDWIEKDLSLLEQALEQLSVNVPHSKIVQHGRVIALRHTDTDRIYSAFKAALYLGKYNDMDNTERFLTKMVKSHHSYEPIRGENVLFLFIATGKPVYDHMTTYTVGRPTRIAGGQRANLPWGIEIPTEMKDREGYIQRNMQRVKDVINLTGKGNEKPEHREQLQAARSELPVGYIMPPFLLEFSEEALIKSVLRQRLWEQGAQGATVDIVNDMWECLLQLDQEKWSTLEDYHGQETIKWEKAMRTLRDKKYTITDFIDLCIEKGLIPESNLGVYSGEDGDTAYDLEHTNLYDLLMATVGKLPPTMWDKMSKGK